jgi:hypothetical protein
MRARAGGVGPCLSEPFNPQPVDAGRAGPGGKGALRRLSRGARARVGSGSRLGDTRRDDNDAPTA